MSSNETKMRDSNSSCCSRVSGGAAVEVAVSSYQLSDDRTPPAIV